MAASITKFLKHNGDISFIVTLGVILPLLPSCPIVLVRVLLGLGAVLVAPGYVLGLITGTWREEGLFATRLGLSFGLSIAVIPILALVLYTAGLGVQLASIITGLSVWFIVGGVFALWRRIRQPQQTNTRAVSSILPSIKLTGLVAFAAIVLISLAAVFAFARPSPQPTEFYMLGLGNRLERYPEQVAINQPFQIPIGIINNEGNNTSYQLEVRVGDELLSKMENLNLASGQKWEQSVGVTFHKPGTNQQIRVLLFHNQDSQPYRQLYFWADIA